MVTITGAEIIELARLVLSRGLFFTIGMIVGAVIILIILLAIRFIPHWDKIIRITKFWRQIKVWKEEEDGNK